MVKYKTKESVEQLLILQKEKTGSRGNSLRKRLENLDRLKKMLIENEQLFLNALKKDLGKSAVESYTSELAVILNEIDFMKKHLKKWIKPKRQRRLSLSGWTDTEVTPLPYGSVLILSPWNYPLQLTLVPLVGALAAGNSCVIKPSEYVPTVSKLVAELLGKYLKPAVAAVVEGDAQAAAEIVSLKWDFIFFTGSKRVGKLVHQAAAKRQIPVVLELGGKNPCIIDPSGFTKAGVREIAWGKYLNAGQTCIAPDMVYVHESIYQDFLKQLKEEIRQLYSEDPKQSQDYGKIIHRKEWPRLLRYVEEGTVFYGGENDQTNRYFAPTILTDIPEGSSILEEEIFAPILPVIPYRSVKTIADHLSKKEVPLVTYVFSRDEKKIDYLNQRLRSGSFSVNQVIRFAARPTIPFGGLKESGFGRYHGRASIETFSFQHVFYKQKNTSSLKQQYPPYQMNQLKVLKKWRKRLF